jgi:hypothetical protein
MLFTAEYAGVALRFAEKVLFSPVVLVLDSKTANAKPLRTPRGREEVSFTTESTESSLMRIALDGLDFDS